MSIAVDASSPARVDKPGTSSSVSTTASFNPPASLLVACCSGDGVGGESFTMSNDGTALTWVPIALRNSTDSGGLSGCAQAFYAVLATARTGMTVTATYSVNNDTSFKVYVVTEVDSADPLGGFTEGSTTTASITTTAFTSESANGLAFVVTNDFNATGNPTSSDTTFDAGTIPSQISYGSGYKTLGAAGSSVTFALTYPAGPQNNWVSFEVEPAVAAPSGPRYQVSQYSSFH